MLSLFHSYRKDERGASATEYAMLIVFVALAIAIGAQTLGGNINDLFTKLGTTITGVPIPSP